MMLLESSAADTFDLYRVFVKAFLKGFEGGESYVATLGLYLIFGS